MERSSNFALAIAILIGSIVSAIIISNTLVYIKSASRFVEVKGLAEKEVKADVAVWTINFYALDDDLLSAQGKIDNDFNVISVFLKKYNIAENEISKSNLRINDKLLGYYDANNKGPRYNIYQDMVVRTNKIEDVLKANQNISELINSNVAISNNFGPRYIFTKLNDIKPTMIAEATKQAKKAADEFAINSQSKVGKIKTATQGAFSISSQESPEFGLAKAEYSGSNEESYINKTVKVVTRVEYFLED